MSKLDLTCGGLSSELAKKYDFLNTQKKKWDPDQLDDLGKRIIRASARYEAMSRVFKNIDEQLIVEAAKVKSKADREFILRLGDLINLNPNKSDRIHEFLANQFNLKARILGLDPYNYSVPGQVRQTILQSRRLAEGMIESVARFEGARKVSNLVKEFKVKLRGKGLPTGYKDINELLLDVIEVGQIPHIRNVYGLSPNADVFNLSRHSKLVQSLADIGLSTREINEIVQISMDISARMDEVRAYAKAYGVDIGNQEGIGFFMRQLTPEASKWINTKRVTSRDILNTFKVDGAPLAAKNALDKSRKTFWYIPEDEALLSLQLKLEPEELHELIQKPKAMSRYIHENLTGNQIDQLIDTGILSKVPMTTRELSDYMLRQYRDLPFKGMQEIFETNPEVMFRNYKDLLSRSAGESAMARTVLRDGMDAGWAITNEMRLAQLDEFKDFVPLRTEALEKYVPGWRNDEVLSKLYTLADEKIYLHPTVYRSWEAIQEVSTSPRNMGAFASALGYWTSFFTKSLLTTPQYAARILWSSTIALQSSGGSIFRLHEGLSDYLKLMSRGYEALDNTRGVYKIGDNLFTKRQIVEEYVKRRGGDVVPFTENLQAGRLNFKAINPTNLPRAINYIAKYIQAFGAKEGIVLTGEMLNRMNDAVLAPIGLMANFFEQGSKLASLYSLLDQRMNNEVGRFISSAQLRRSFDSFDSLLKHVDDYFYTWDDPGKTTAFVGRYVLPFASYLLTNPPAQIRHAIRNPRAFVNYYRVRSFINAGAAGDEEVVEGSVPDWLLESSPLFVTKTSDGRWLTLLTNNYDPVAEAWSTIDRISEYGEQLMGWFSGTASDKREQFNDDRNAAMTVIQDLFKVSNPLIRNTTGVLLNIDPRTGRKLTEAELAKRPAFLGIHLPASVRFILQSYGPLDYIDRSNIGEVFGRPEIRDARTNEILVYGKPSIFGAERTRIQRDKYTAGEWSAVVKALSILGFNVKVVDTAYSMQWTYEDIERNVNQLEKYINRAANDLQAGKYINPDGRVNTRLRLGTQEYERIQAELDGQIDQWVQLKFDQARVYAWMIEHNIPRRRVYEELSRKALRELGIPTLADERAQEIVDTMIELKRKIGTAENE